MGRRRQEPEPEPEFVPEVPEEPDELEQAIAGLPRDTSVITLYRIPDQGKPRYVTRLTPEEFDLEQIKRVFGGGRYRYVAIQGGIKVQQGHFEIEGEPVIGGQKATAPANEISVLSEKLDRMLDALASRPPMQTGPAADLQEKLVTALLAKVLGDKDNAEDKLLEKLSAYKALFGGGGGDSNVALVLEAVKQGMMLSGDGSGPSPIMYLVDKLAPSIEKTVDLLSRGKERPPVHLPQPALPQVSETFRPFMPFLRPYLPALIASASVDASPESWADIIESHIPEKERETMKAWLRGESWFKDLCALDGKISLQAAWWGELRGMLLEEEEPALLTPDNDRHPEGSPGGEEE